MLALLTGNWEPGAKAKLSRFDLNRLLPLRRLRLRRHRPLGAPAGGARPGRAGDAGAGSVPEEVLIVGDSIHDVSCAHAHGIPCLAVETGRTPAERPSGRRRRLDRAGPPLRRRSVPWLGG